MVASLGLVKAADADGNVERIVYKDGVTVGIEIGHEGTRYSATHPTGTHYTLFVRRGDVAPISSRAQEARAVVRGMLHRGVIHPGER